MERERSELTSVGVWSISETSQLIGWLIINLLFQLSPIYALILIYVEYDL